MAARILSKWILLVLSVHWIFPLITVVECAANTSTTATSCFAADLAALRSFAANCASATITEHWKGDDCCSWEGVNCTTSTLNAGTGPGTAPASSSEPAVGRVSQLSLVIGGFTGPEALLSLCGLSALSFLDLESNVFPSSTVVSIPECMGTSLTNLETLRLLYFGDALAGSIPRSFSGLRSLRELSLEGNDGLSGPFPLFLLSDLPNLTRFELSSNSFSGSIPACHAPHLQYLDLSFNAFSGNLSDFFSHSNLPNLSTLLADGNALSGDIPPFDPARFSSLEVLSLDDNSITGSLPKSLCELITLKVLSLSSNALRGQIPSECQRLASLSVLHLSNNRFTGPFPSWVCFLSNLFSLDLSYNNFTGSLPDEWHALARLQELFLSGNSLVPDPPANSPVQLPLWLFRFPLTSLGLASMRLQPADLDCGSRLLLLNTTLWSLDISDNNLSSSATLWCLSVPHNNFASLSGLNISGNPLALTLNGSDPVKLLLMHKSIEYLYLSSCELNGSLAYMFTEGTMPPIRVLNLANNGLVGEIPPQLGNLSYLEYLDLSNNFFTRFSPFRDHKSPAPADFLRFIDLSSNRLTGDLSSTLLNLYNYSSLDELGRQCGLWDVDLSNNCLTGGIPASLGKCVSMYRLKLHDNFLEGMIPDELFSNTSLQILSLSNNRLTGPLPSSIRKQEDLVFLDLSRNSFVGDLQTLLGDDSCSNFAKLRVLLVGHNHFTGSIGPVCLGKSTEALQVIDFSNNHLKGHIPDTLQELPAFRTIQDPGLSVPAGTLYEEFRISAKGRELPYAYALRVLTSLDLSGNHLSGPILAGVDELSGLMYLNLSRNNLSGPIPSDLGKLSALQSLDLSYNQLSGSIPASFSALTGLEVFNVSFNEGLGGPIPQQPQLEVAESYIGDPNLCGEPILHACAGPPFTNQPTHERTTEESSFSFSRWIDEWVSIPALCLGYVVGLLGTLVLIIRWWRP